MTFVNQEYDLQDAAQEYTIALDAYRERPAPSTKEILNMAARKLGAAALRFSAFVVDDRVPDPNARVREIPAALERIATGYLLRRLATEQLARDLYTGPPERPEPRGAEILEARRKESK